MNKSCSLEKDKQLNLDNILKIMKTIIDSNDKNDYVDEVILDKFNTKSLELKLKDLYGDTLKVSYNKSYSL